MMAKNSWHKRYHGAALGGYMGLSLEERGAYTTVLDLMYDTDWEPGIRDNDRWIAGHLDVSVRKWRTLRDCLFEKGKLDIFEGHLSNKKYREVRENALEKSRKCAENGASGGDKSGEVRRKAAENRQSVEANASDLPLYTRAKEIEIESRVIPDGITSTAPPEPARKAAKSSIAMEQPEGVDEQVWIDFLAHRKRKRADVTPTALGIIEKEAAKARWSLNDALAECVARNWQGFKAEWVQDRRNGNANGRDNRDGFTKAIDRELGLD